MEYFYAATVVYFCSGEWCVFTPALTALTLDNVACGTRDIINEDYFSKGSAFGWLLTGDAKLGNKARRHSWLRFYQPLRNNICKMMLPHHGAVANFNSEMLSLVNDNVELFVTANAEDDLRPHEDVLSELDERTCHIVSEQTDDKLRDISGLSLLSGHPDKAKKIFSDWI